MYLFTHSAHREMERDMDTGHREIEIREIEERLDGRLPTRVTYRMLLEAAILRTKIEQLPSWLQNDPAIFDRVLRDCRGRDNPLHVGALYGNVDFVREILNRKRELTHELNSEGQSPLHLASARGHVDVVKEILSKDACLARQLNSKGQSPLHLASASGYVEVVQEILSKDADACFIRDEDGMIPLHLAAINGRVEVLEELVEAVEITAFILTKSGEPILHLCANNNKYKALKTLIRLVQAKDRLVKLRDRQDNTILHLLSAKGKYGVIKLLLKNTEVDVNAKNVDGLTPSEFSMLHNKNPLLEFKIQRLLTKAGDESGWKQNISPFACLGPMRILMPGKDESRFGESLLVVAILMATVAFQAGLSPPGGVWQDTTFNNGTLPNVTQSSPPPNLVPHYAGKSIMSYVDPRRYNSFSISNDFTLSFSLLAIQLQLASYLFKSTILQWNAVLLTSLSVVTMSVTYYTSATYISLHKQLILILVLISSIMLYISSGFWVYRLHLKLLVLEGKSAKSRRKAQPLHP